MRSKSMLLGKSWVPSRAGPSYLILRRDGDDAVDVVDVVDGGGEDDGDDGDDQQQSDSYQDQWVRRPLLSCVGGFTRS